MSIPIQFFFWAVALVVMLSILVGVIRTGISPMPSSRLAVKQVVQLVTPTLPGPLYELGAAWGSLVFPLARACPNRQIVAYELSTIPWLFLLLRVRISGLTNIEVVRRDFFRDELGKAAAVVCYLYPERMVRLGTKLQSKLIPGTVAVSNTVALPGWVPNETSQLEDLYPKRIYCFIVDQKADE